MARVLVVTTAEKGHVNPMIGVAQWLAHDDHEVGWLTLPVPSEQVAQLGFETLSLEGTAPPSDFPTDGPALASLVRDGDQLRVWIRRLLLEAVPSQVGPMRALISRWRPHAIALDPMIYAAIIAAHLQGVPYAGISSSLNPITPDDFDCAHQRNMRALAEDRASLFASFGLYPRFRVADCLAPRLNTVFATEAYALPFASVPENTFLVGPSLPRSARGDETPLPPRLSESAHPLVYASFGSQIWYQPRAFLVVAEACCDLGLDLLITGGGLVDEHFDRELPGNVEVVRYAPQLAVLERARVLVTHGGSNSVMEALAHRVPILISPVCNDQPIQAAFAERAGVGVRVDLHVADRATVRDALESLTRDDSPHRAHAARIGASYQAQDGAREVARRIAELIA